MRLSQPETGNRQPKTERSYYETYFLLFALFVAFASASFAEDAEIILKLGNALTGKQGVSVRLNGERIAFFDNDSPRSVSIAVNNGKNVVQIHSGSTSAFGGQDDKTITCNSNYDTQIVHFNIGSKELITNLRVEVQKSTDTLARQSYDKLKARIPRNSRIAIMLPAAVDFISDDLEIILVEYDHVVFTRKDLEVIFREQGFQASGDVDERTAVEAGKLAGANLLITGSVRNNGASKRLFIRMLDAKTGQVVTNSVVDF